MKTLAIRLDDDLHAQLSVMAQLANVSVTDAIRQAIENHLATMRSNPELSARAEAVLADIERDAADRKQAIADLFGSVEADAPAPGRPAGSHRAAAVQRHRRADALQRMAPVDVLRKGGSLRYEMQLITGTPTRVTNS